MPTADQNATNGKAPRALIGFGHVWHRRLRPVANAFRYPSYFLMLPLRSLRRTDGAYRELPRNRFGLLSFHDRDHGEGSPDALAWFDRTLREQGILDADGEVWLQTYPRVLGYAFKPVSFWYAERADGSLRAILAEVNNTFGERHCYLLEAPSLGWSHEHIAAKAFHVSPFCRLEGHYRFRFHRSVPSAWSCGSRTRVRVDLHDSTGPVLQTGLGGELSVLDAASIRRAFFGTPLMTLGVIARIHWQALRLGFKGLAFVAKPPAPEHLVTR